MDDRLDALTASAPSVAGKMKEADPLNYDARAGSIQEDIGARVVVINSLGNDTYRAGRRLERDHGARGSERPRGPAGVSAERVPAYWRRGRAWPGRQERRARRGGVPLSETRRSCSCRPRFATRWRASASCERTLLVAGLAALLIAWFAGSLAALRLTHRIRRLEEAAGRIAARRLRAGDRRPGRGRGRRARRAFDRMRLRLAQLDRARREFIANASHELRTPLFSLGGFLELMADEDIEPAVRRDFVEEMSAQVDAADPAGDRSSRPLAPRRRPARGRAAPRSTSPRAHASSARSSGRSPRRASTCFPADVGRPGASRSQTSSASCRSRASSSRTRSGTRPRGRASWSRRTTGTARSPSRSTDDGPGVPRERPGASLRALLPRRGRPGLRQRARARDRVRARRPHGRLDRARLAGPARPSSRCSCHERSQRFHVETCRPSGA